MRKANVDQMEFVWKDADGLADELQSALGVEVHVTITNNTSSVMSMRWNRLANSVRVRVHHMFLHAEPAVVHALVAWIRSPRAKRAGSVLNRFIAENRPLIRTRSAVERRLVTQGDYHDLQRLFDELNVSEFNGTVTARITWGREAITRRRRTILYGSFYPGEHLIRIHPSLDQDFVPEHFVRYIVFHEMLHAFLGIEETESGRRRIHDRAFKEREAQYADFERSAAWGNDRKHLARMLGHKS